ncbi:Flp family type IVb pilin [Elioraea thermophila]|uniref:Flp family type IVb pilin n=1 Tax=Elioraea thermophila TaxID=2185104 RepID=UPI000DF1367D|nr:Flp family type IVb pilin [Elioraea thermophila]
MLKAWTYVSSRLAALKRDERGVTALEYGVIAGVLIVALVTAFNLLGDRLVGVFERVGGQLSSE